MPHAYASANLLSSLAAAAYTWTPSTTTNRLYLSDGRMDKVFSVASTATTVSVVIDLGIATTLSFFALLNSNIASAVGAAVLIDGATDAGITTSVYTKSASTLYTTAPRQKDHVLQFAPTSKRYWRITWTWTGSFALTIGEIFAGVSTSLTRGKMFGWGETEEYVTTRSNGYSGETRGHFIAGPFREKELLWSDFSEAENAELLAMFRSSRGGALPTLWLESYEATAMAAAAAQQDVILGRFAETRFKWKEFDFGRFEPAGLTLRSLAREVGA